MAVALSGPGSRRSGGQVLPASGLGPGLSTSTAVDRASSGCSHRSKGLSTAAVLACVQLMSRVAEPLPRSRQPGRAVARPPPPPLSPGPGVWNYPTRSRDCASSSDEHSDTGPDHPDRNRGDTAPRTTADSPCAVRAQSHSHVVPIL